MPNPTTTHTTDHVNKGKKKKSKGTKTDVSKSKNGYIKRVYLEKNYYSKKQGGGSFFEWIDMYVGNNKIDISRLSSLGEGKDGKQPPVSGSGSGASYEYKEAKVLIRLLQEGIKLIEQK